MRDRDCFDCAHLLGISLEPGARRSARLSRGMHASGGKRASFAAVRSHRRVAEASGRTFQRILRLEPSHSVG